MNHESCLETQVTELSQEHSEEKYYLYLNFGAAFAFIKNRLHDRFSFSQKEVESGRDC